MKTATVKVLELPSTYYRATAKALIKDDQNRLLVVRNEHGHDELPGGGIEFGESFDACLVREVQEELGVSVRERGRIVCVYMGSNHDTGVPTIRIAASVTLDSHNFVLSDGMVDYRFVTREEFMTSNLDFDEQGVKLYVDEIFSTE